MRAAIAVRRLEFRHLPKTYSALVRMFPPRPLHDEVDVANATEVIDAMAGHELSRDQEDYLDLLSDLVRKHEETHHPAPPASSTPLERLRYLLDEAGMNASDLGRLLSNRGLGCRVLRGERQLSKAHIRTLSAHFKVSPAFFF
jgi:HTH-type transcriptional regulator/antitoxin HigA